MTQRKSPKPLPTPLAMSTRLPDPAEPTASPIPKHHESHTSELPQRPRKKPVIPTPKLRLEIRDLSHAGASKYQDNAHSTKLLGNAITTVLESLYGSFGDHVPYPPVRSITLVLRPMEGVAYTTGSELDNEHKEIHFSLDYINHVADDRIEAEITGVIVHEMVHVWQWNGLGTAPGGLIEGVADYVRLKAGYDPPHWRRKPGKAWDEGYERTAFFFEWLEEVHGAGRVMKINEYLKDHRYEEKEFWKALFSESIDSLWKQYNKDKGTDEAG
jgi:hypothetical protein